MKELGKFVPRNAKFFEEQKNNIGHKLELK
jgi:hypothetical protein